MSEAASDPAPTAVDYLREALAETTAAVESLDHDTRLLREVDDFNTVLELLAEATKLQARLKIAVGGIHDRAWALRGDAWGNYHHPDLGVVSVRRTASRPRWDHDSIAERVIEQHVRANEGEAPDPTTVARWLIDAAAFSYWRKGILADLGIDVAGEDLYWSEPGTPTIGFPSQSG